MTVLVVDDQTNVVSGIISGVHWSDIGVSKVLPAYNAFEAKQVLSTEKIDIMLCDIEMPVESGLDLFRWVRKQGLDTECIFLTAHADFFMQKRQSAWAGSTISSSLPGMRTSRLPSCGPSKK
ncbi:response regulator [Anaeromassilibacillus sp. 1001302B_160321_C8]|uniref:response regulator n=1 Tax=Anaeromassilibacillus sp. 1001302B_160321_C8 TaxID=2787132 RepID=UPI00189B10D3|nr:response regulator [Anaeromassilibacillus sp. 1001302B_160321_C8]